MHTAEYIFSLIVFIIVISVAWGAVADKIWIGHGFWWGFFLGPLGVVVVVLLKTNNSIVEQTKEISKIEERLDRLDKIDRHICGGFNWLSEFASSSSSSRN